MCVSLWKRAALCLACFGMVIPQGGLVAAEKKQQKTARVLEVKMTDGGTVTGQLVDAQGKVLKNEDVLVRFHNQVVAQTKTNDQGRYAVKGLRGGLHQLETENGRVNARFWNAEQAPPAAKPVAVIVSDKNIVRAQCGEAGCGIGGGGLFGHGGAVGNGGLVGNGWVDGYSYGGNGGFADGGYGFGDGGYGFGDGGFYGGDAYCYDYGYGYGGGGFGGGGGLLGGGGGLFGGGALLSGLVIAGVVTAIAVAADDDDGGRRSP